MLKTLIAAVAAAVLTSGCAITGNPGGYGFSDQYFTVSKYIAAAKEAGWDVPYTPGEFAPKDEVMVTDQYFTKEAYISAAKEAGWSGTAD